MVVVLQRVDGLAEEMRELGTVVVRLKCVRKAYRFDTELLKLKKARWCARPR